MLFLVSVLYLVAVGANLSVRNSESAFPASDELGGCLTWKSSGRVVVARCRFVAGCREVCGQLKRTDKLLDAGLEERQTALSV